jgi:hypothetical protein
MTTSLTMTQAVRTLISDLDDDARYSDGAFEYDADGLLEYAAQCDAEEEEAAEEEGREPMGYAVTGDAIYLIHEDGYQASAPVVRVTAR